MYYLVIVGPKDNPIYEKEYQIKESKLKEEEKHLKQFIVHSSLDIVDDCIWNNSFLYLKTVDKFRDWFVSAYVIPSYTKLILLHKVRNDDSIRNFFIEVHEAYIKALLNPFFSKDGINAPSFDRKIEIIFKKYF